MTTIGTSNIKQITCYQTSDNKVWTTLEQAEFWEKVVESMRKNITEYAEKETYNMRNEGYTNTYFPVGRD